MPLRSMTFPLISCACLQVSVTCNSILNETIISFQSLKHDFRKVKRPAQRSTAGKQQVPPSRLANSSTPGYCRPQHNKQIVWDLDFYEALFPLSQWNLLIGALDLPGPVLQLWKKNHSSKQRGLGHWNGQETNTAEALDYKLDDVDSLHYAAELKYQRHHMLTKNRFNTHCFPWWQRQLISQLSQNNP